MKILRKLRSMFSNPIPANLLLLLVIYTGVRLVFFAFQHSEYAGHSVGTVVSAFSLGVRFDLATIAFTNIPFIFLSLLPASVVGRKMFQHFLKGTFLLCNSIILGVMIADLQYYQFTGSRITVDVFLLKSEALAQSSQLIFHYWYLLVFFALVAFILNRFYSKPAFPMNQQPSLLNSTLFRAAVVLLTITAARGGLQLKPLKPLYAFTSGDQELGILSLNSGFTLIRSKLDNGLKSVHDFTSDQVAEDILTQKKLPPMAGPNKQNVVIIILESFATEFVGAANDGVGYTPFFDSLAAKGLLFKNNFANGRRSIEGLPSVLFGVPSMMPTPISQSNFQTNRWEGLGRVLGANGYRTSFFHGAKSGTMYFDAISRSAGMNDYYTLESYPDAERDFDGSWGIFDEPFLLFMASKLKEHPEPFFSVVFTLSSHQPYRVPDQYESRFPPGNMSIHRSIQYVDYSLSKFFEAAEKTDWYKNTLFIFTGDHTQETKSLNYDTTLGRYMVPLLFFHPERSFPNVDRNRVTQHADIFPSALHFLGVSIGRRPLFGRSVFGDDEGEAVISSNSMDWIVSNQGVIQRDSQDRFIYSSYEGKDTTFHHDLAPTPKSEVLTKRLMAYRQHFNNGLLKNTFYRLLQSRITGGGSSASPQ